MSWQDKEQVKKGNIGELIVRKHLEKNGFIVYEPKTNAPHPFDKIAIKSKNNMVIVEVKTKARMNKFNATGFDLKSYKYYKLIRDKYNIPLYCFFVDEQLGEVYGNKLSILEENYKDNKGIVYPNTKIVNNIILFSLDKMKKIHTLTDQQKENIKKHSTRNYDYSF